MTSGWRSYCRGAVRRRSGGGQDVELGQGSRRAAGHLGVGDEPEEPGGDRRGDSVNVVDR